jgi:hypothetical protein
MQVMTMSGHVKCVPPILDTIHWRLTSPSHFSIHSDLQDVENNTVLHILADTKGASVTSPYHGYSTDPERVGSALRMSKFYWERYPDTLDWSNDKGRTALHVAALKGSEELVQVTCPWLYYFH